MVMLFIIPVEFMKLRKFLAVELSVAVELQKAAVPVHEPVILTPR